jgi:hypothetical protein
MKEKPVHNNFRNTELLQKLERNPLKAQMARALDVAEIFAGDVEYLSLDKNLSPQGRDNARRAKLRAAVRDNRDARGPVNDLKAKLEAKRAAVQRPPLDRTIVAVDDRRELRTILRGMDSGARALLLSGAGADPDFVDRHAECAGDLGHVSIWLAARCWKQSRVMCRSIGASAWASPAATPARRLPDFGLERTAANGTAFGLSAAYPQAEKPEYGQSDSGLLRTNSQAAWASDETIFQSLRSRPEIITR